MVVVDKKDDRVKLFRYPTRLPPALMGDVGFPNGIMIEVICKMVSSRVGVELSAVESKDKRRKDGAALQESRNIIEPGRR